MLLLGPRLADNPRFACRNEHQRRLNVFDFWLDGRLNDFYGRFHLLYGRDFNNRSDFNRLNDWSNLDDRLNDFNNLSRLNDRSHLDNRLSDFNNLSHLNRLDDRSNLDDRLNDRSNLDSWKDRSRKIRYDLRNRIRHQNTESFDRHGSRFGRYRRMCLVVPVYPAKRGTEDASHDALNHGIFGLAAAAVTFQLCFGDNIRPLHPFPIDG